MLYLLLVKVFTRLPKRLWFFALLGYGEGGREGGRGKGRGEGVEEDGRREIGEVEKRMREDEE